VCLGQGPFRLVQGDEETTLENIFSLMLLDGGVQLIDVFGKAEEVSGCIDGIDLLNRRIVLV
jgi:predicted RNA-binding protein